MAYLQGLRKWIRNHRLVSAKELVDFGDPLSKQHFSQYYRYLMTNSQSVHRQLHRQQHLFKAKLRLVYFRCSIESFWFLQVLKMVYNLKPFHVSRLEFEYSQFWNVHLFLKFCLSISINHTNSEKSAKTLKFILQNYPKTQLYLWLLHKHLLELKVQAR